MSAAAIKRIAMTAMFIDHFAASILYRVIHFKNTEIKAWMLANLENYQEVIDILTLIYEFMRSIGRLSFPIFCFFIVEGMFHTRSKLKYAIRMFIFALISEIPFDIALFGKISDFKHQNVYFTLLIGLVAIWGIIALRKKMDENKMKRWAWILCTVLITGASTYVSSLLKTDYSVIGVLAIIMIYMVKVCKKDDLLALPAVFGTGMAVCWQFRTISQIPFSLVATFAGILAIMYLSLWEFLNKEKMIVAGILVLCATNASEIAALAALFMIHVYNGEKGKGSKLLFYAFYPAHLAVLAVFGVLIGLIKLRFNF